MKIKQKLIDTKKFLVDFGKEHKECLFGMVIGTAYVAGAIYAGKFIKSSIREIAENTSKGSMEIDGKEYKLSEDGDFITVEEWNEHTK